MLTKLHFFFNKFQMFFLPLLSLWSLSLSLSSACQNDDHPQIGCVFFFFTWFVYFSLLLSFVSSQVLWFFFPWLWLLCHSHGKIASKLKLLIFCLEIIFLQPSLEESSFNPLRGKQIDHLHVYFKKLLDSLKMSYD